MSPRVEGGSVAVFPGAAAGIAYGGVGADSPHKIYTVRQSYSHKVAKSLFSGSVPPDPADRAIEYALYVGPGPSCGIPGDGNEFPGELWGKNQIC